jgi:hypothetical protein
MAWRSNCTALRLAHLHPTPACTSRVLTQEHNNPRHHVLSTENKSQQTKACSALVGIRGMEGCLRDPLYDSCISSSETPPSTSRCSISTATSYSVRRNTSQSPPVLGRVFRSQYFCMNAIISARSMTSLDRSLEHTHSHIDQLQYESQLVACMVRRL